MTEPTYIRALASPDVATALADLLDRMGELSAAIEAGQVQVGPIGDRYVAMTLSAYDALSAAILRSQG